MTHLIKHSLKILIIALSTSTVGSCNSDEPDNNNDNKPDSNGYEYVDLGLSVRWASCNVGAQSPEEPGFLFAWGEVEPKEIFERDNYEHYEKSYNDQTGRYDYLYSKYCTDPAFGMNDGIKLLEKDNDAAHVNMGGDWRMPTSAEIRELMLNCKREYITVNDNFCVKFIGPNGNYILLPGLTMAEYTWDSDKHSYTSYHIRTDKPETGGIWASSLCVLYEQAQNYASGLNFHSALPSLAIEPGKTIRWSGMAVRGVLEQ